MQTKDVIVKLKLNVGRVEVHPHCNHPTTEWQQHQHLHDWWCCDCYFYVFCPSLQPKTCLPFPFICEQTINLVGYASVCGHIDWFIQKFFLLLEDVYRSFECLGTWIQSINWLLSRVNDICNTLCVFWDILADAWKFEWFHGDGCFFQLPSTAKLWCSIDIAESFPKTANDITYDWRS